MSTPPAFGPEFFAQYTTQEVRMIVAGGQEEVKRRVAVERADAVAQIHVIADRVGIPAAELIGQPRKQMQKVPARYRNPSDAAQTWTGRGRQPRWVPVALAGGATMKSMEISSGPAQP